MLWEIIATASAGIGAAGIALVIRFLFKKSPKWLVSVFAGMGVLLFAIYSEYSWASYTQSRLPQGSVVVAEIPHTAFYKPWSYIKPQILQFVVADKTGVQSLDNQPHIKQVPLYFFERRMKAHQLTILVNCQSQEQTSQINSNDWSKLTYTQNIIKAVC